MELRLQDWVSLLSWAPKTHSWVGQPQKHSVEMFPFLRDRTRVSSVSRTSVSRARQNGQFQQKLFCSLRKPWLRNNFLQIPGRCWASWIPCSKVSGRGLALAPTQCEVWCGGHENAHHTLQTQGEELTKGLNAASWNPQLLLYQRYVSHERLQPVALWLGQ